MSYKQIRNDLGDLVKASYLPQKEAQSFLEKKKYKLDPELSKMDTKVFTDENNTPLIIHRGTHTLKDVIDDGLLAVGLGKYGHRYNEAQRITKNAEDKYNKPANTIGHSYGGWLSENSGAKGNIVTYNKAVGLGDIGKKKNSNRQLDVSVKGDRVSGLGLTQTANKETIENKHQNKNFITAHDTDNLFID